MYISFSDKFFYLRHSHIPALQLYLSAIEHSEYIIPQFVSFLNTFAGDVELHVCKKTNEVLQILRAWKHLLLIN